MNETLEYIETYFENGLTADERKLFEQRISNDQPFAKEVAFYLQTRHVLRQDLLKQKAETWQAQPVNEALKTAPVVSIKKQSQFKRWIAVAAVIVITLGVSLTMILGGNTATQMAKSYSDSAFELLDLTMGSQDSLQQGIDAYNQGNLTEAEQVFTAVYAAHPDKLKALRFLGVVSLKNKDYDKAYEHFGKLASYKALVANPGVFYQAITILMRNKDGDKDKARQLLQQVINEKMFGEAKARQMLEKLNT